MWFCATCAFHFPPSIRVYHSTQPLAKWSTFLINIWVSLVKVGKDFWLAFQWIVAANVSVENTSCIRDD